MCACLAYIILSSHCMFFEVEGMFTFRIIKQRLQFESLHFIHVAHYVCVQYLYSRLRN